MATMDFSRHPTLTIWLQIETLEEYKQGIQSYTCAGLAGESPHQNSHPVGLFLLTLPKEHAKPEQSSGKTSAGRMCLEQDHQHSPAPKEREQDLTTKQTSTPNICPSSDTSCSHLIKI